MAWEDLKRIGKRGKKKDLPEGLWVLCKGCKNTVYKAAVEENLHTCPECGHHFSIEPLRRIGMHFDKGSFSETDSGMESTDPLEFSAVQSYRDKLEESKRKTQMKTAVISGRASIKGMPVYIVLTDSRFMMGSMGSVVGEKITRTFERAMDEKLPVVTITGSGGGARMYEGMISLMQMAKTSAAVAKFNDRGLPYISIVTNPTMAGVMASFASLGDVVMAEPGALIGFTGPRVIKQTINADLPEGFQSSEFLLEHGLIDLIVPRIEIRDTLADLLYYMSAKQ
jgi:acetyl-CoA carboxylase carboxyl transferase subunit beta